MRRIVAAASFSQEIESIGTAVEQRFGEDARDKFVTDLTRLCDVISYFPHIGNHRHGYDTPLTGIVFRQNWIFFDFDDDEVRFLHIVDARRDRRTIAF